MGTTSQRYKEIAIDLVLSEAEGDQERHYRTYALSIQAPTASYTSSDIQESTSRFSDPRASRASQWDEIETGKLVLNWEKFKECRRQFRRGETPSESSWTELCAEYPKVLTMYLSGDCASRVWWSSSDHQIASFPWEALIPRAADNFSFVRGKPPTSILPRLPVGDRLRLAFIHDPAETDPALLLAMQQISGVEVVPMTDDPRAALQRAAGENFELVHLVTDGGLSLASEGVLYLKRQVLPAGSSLAQTSIRGPREGERWKIAARAVLDLGTWIEPLTPKFSSALYSLVDAEIGVQTFTTGDISETFRGSRTTLLTLSPKRSALKSTEDFLKSLLPSVFRSFSAIGSNPSPMPSILTTLGRMSPDQTKRFWPKFYAGVAQTKSLEQGLRNALDIAPGGPVALFLRHRLRRQFVSQAAPTAEVTSDKPERLAAELAAANRFMNQIREIDSRYSGSTLKITESPAFVQELDRHKQLEQKLKTWMEPEDDEHANQ